MDRTGPKGLQQNTETKAPTISEFTDCGRFENKNIMGFIAKTDMRYREGNGMRQASLKAGVVVVFFTLLTCALSAQKQSSSSDRPQTEIAAHSIGVDVDIVLATVTVTDRSGRYVTGLEKENFKIQEDKVNQEIKY